MENKQRHTSLQKVRKACVSNIMPSDLVEDARSAYIRMARILTPQGWPRPRQCSFNSLRRETLVLSRLIRQQPNATTNGQFRNTRVRTICTWSADLSSTTVLDLLHDFDRSIGIFAWLIRSSARVVIRGEPTLPAMKCELRAMVTNYCLRTVRFPKWPDHIVPVRDFLPVWRCDIVQ